MSSRLRKILSLLIILTVIVGWYVTIFGIGKIHSIKDLMKFGLDINGGVYVVMEAETKQDGEELAKTMDQTRQVLGTSEATVSLEGKKRIRVELPGVEDADEAIEKVGQTAKLSFLLSDGTKVLDGKDVKNASIDTDSEHGGYKIKLEFTSEGTKKFTAATSKAASGSVKSSNKDVQDNAIMIVLDKEVISAPTVNSTINSSSCEITRGGGFDREEASNLAALIRGGALPVELKEVTSSVQTATIGENALKMSIIAGAIGLLCVFILMILMYNILGLMADIALLLYGDSFNFTRYSSYYLVYRYGRRRQCNYLLTY